VKLTVDGKSWTQPLTLKMDPRVKAAPEELARQFEVEQDAVRGMDQSFAALTRVRLLREQLKDRAAKAGKGALGDSIAALDKKLEQLAGAPQGFFAAPPPGKQKENFSTLGQHFQGLLRTADSCDCAPTSQATAAWREMQAARTELAAEWKAIAEKDVPALNQQLEKAGLTALSLKKTGSGKQEDDQEEED